MISMKIFAESPDSWQKKSCYSCQLIHHSIYLLPSAGSVRMSSYWCRTSCYKVKMVLQQSFSYNGKHYNWKDGLSMGTFSRQLPVCAYSIKKTQTHISGQCTHYACNWSTVQCHYNVVNFTTWAISPGPICWPRHMGHFPGANMLTSPPWAISQWPISYKPHNMGHFPGANMLTSPHGPSPSGQYVNLTTWAISQGPIC